jgi:uncharacterized SAM-binding protein YcdF (DUF218 family)
MHRHAREGSGLRLRKRASARAAPGATGSFIDTVFFIASKLIWVLIRPETVLVLLLCLGLLALWREGLRLARRLLGTATAGFLAIAIFPLGVPLLLPLERQYAANPDLTKIAGIIVLGGGEDAVRTAAWGTPAVNDAGDRFLAAIALAQRFPEATLLFTGGSGRLRADDMQEGDVARQIFLSAGVAPERLLLERRSRNTAENATLSKDLLRDGDAGTWVVLVTSAFHMPRAMATFCAAGWTRLVAWPTDFRTAGFMGAIGWDPVGHLHDFNVGLREWVGLLAYRASGRAEGSRGCMT